MRALMRYDLATLTRRANPGIRRRAIVLRDIIAPATLASDLYAAVYKPIVQVWTRHAEAIIAEYERSLSQLTTDSPSDLQARLDAASSDAERLYILLDAGLKDWAVRVEKWHRGKWRGAVLSATGVDLETIIGPEDVRETLASYIEWNVALIRDVNAEARRRISNTVFSGLTERRPVQDVAKQIRESAAMSRRRSIGIAADQLSKTTAALASERRREAGIDRWKWRSSHKLHFRPEHAARDGKIYTDETAPADLPGRLPWCGCREQAVLDLS